MKTEVKTDTNLTTGERTYSVVLDPLPLTTPIGIAPGEVRVKVDKQGRLIDLLIVSRPNPLVFRGALKRLALMATWEVPVEELTQIGAQEHPIVSFKLKRGVAQQILAPIQSAKALGALLQHPLVQDDENYQIEDIEVEG